MFPFYTPCKYKKTFGFLIFSGGINKKGTLERHWLTRLYRPIKHPYMQSKVRETDLKWVTLD